MEELQQFEATNREPSGKLRSVIVETSGNDFSPPHRWSPSHRVRDGSLSRDANEPDATKAFMMRSKSERAEEKNGWSPFRRRCWTMLHNQWFEAATSTIVFLNLILIVYEADHEAQCFPDYFAKYDACPFKSKDIQWAQACNLVLLIVYTCEAALRVYTLRKRFPFSWWNQLDVLVCTTGWIGIVFDGTINLAFLRIVRVGRLARAFRFLFRIRELYLLLNGVMSSLKAIFFGTMLLMVLLIAYSIILVEMVHPANSQITYSTCSECTTAFRSVWWATITLFKQVIAGDSWIISFPLIERQPGVAFIMMVIVVTVSLGMINLILTVIVERAAEAREKDIAENVKQKQKTQEAVKHDLLKVCAEMDDDEDGQLSSQELRWAYEGNAAFRNIMMALDIRECDLESVFKILDTDGTGHLEYQEFCDELIQLQGQDLRVMVALTRFSVHETRTLVERLDKKIEAVLSDMAKHNRVQDAKWDSQTARSGESHEVRAKHIVADLKWPPDFCPESLDTSTGGNTCMPSPPSEETEVMYSADNLVSTLACLQKDIQNLAIVEADVVLEAQKQIATLLSHVELAGAFVDVLPCQDSLHTKCIVQQRLLVSPEHLQMIGSVAETIQHGTLTQLSEAMQALNMRIKHARTILDRQEGLVCKIKGLTPHNVLEMIDTSKCTGTDAMHPISRM